MEIYYFEMFGMGLLANVSLLAARHPKSSLQENNDSEIINRGIDAEVSCV